MDTITVTTETYPVRSIRELLMLMYKNPHLFRGGLCYWCIRLYREGIINEYEHSKLITYIKSNYPLLKYFKRKDYWWDLGEIEPRMEWLVKHISKN